MTGKPVGTMVVVAIAHFCVIGAALAVWTGNRSDGREPSGGEAAEAPLPEHLQDVHWTSPDAFLKNLGPLAQETAASETFVAMSQEQPVIKSTFIDAPSDIVIPSSSVGLPQPLPVPPIPDPISITPEAPARLDSPPLFDAPPLLSDLQPAPTLLVAESEGVGASKITPPEDPIAPEDLSLPKLTGVPSPPEGKLFGIGVPSSVAPAAQDARAHYERLLQSRFLEGWTQPKTAGATPAPVTTTLWVDIARDGTLLSYGISSPSGNPVMDGSVLEAAKRVGSAPRIPDSIPDETYQATLRFRLE